MLVMRDIVAGSKQYACYEIKAICWLPAQFIINGFCPVFLCYADNCFLAILHYSFWFCMYLPGVNLCALWVLKRKGTVTFLMV